MIDLESYVDRMQQIATAATEERITPTYQSIPELIDSGDVKFKLGLAWYVIYDMVDISDYHYIDLLKLPTEEIKRILDERYNYLLLTSAVREDATPADQSYARLMLILKRFRAEVGSFVKSFRYSSPSEMIGNYMYHLLIHPDRYFKSSKPSALADLIGHSANRVIRNYHQCGILKYDPKLLQGEECMNYINNYHKLKGFRCTTGW